jgi:hypothetical protein
MTISPALPHRFIDRRRSFVAASGRTDDLGPCPHKIIFHDHRQQRLVFDEENAGA